MPGLGYNHTIPTFPGKMGPASQNTNMASPLEMLKQENKTRILLSRSCYSIFSSGDLWGVELDIIFIFIILFQFSSVVVLLYVAGATNFRSTFFL